MTQISFKCDNKNEWIDAQKYAISSGYSWKIFVHPNEPIHLEDKTYPMYLYLNTRDHSLEYDTEYTEMDDELGYMLVEYSNYIRKYKIYKLL